MSTLTPIRSAVTAIRPGDAAYDEAVARVEEDAVGDVLGARVAHDDRRPVHRAPPTERSPGGRAAAVSDHGHRAEQSHDRSPNHPAIVG